MDQLASNCCCSNFELKNEIKRFVSTTRLDEYRRYDEESKLCNENCHKYEETLAEKQEGGKWGKIIRLKRSHIFGAVLYDKLSVFWESGKKSGPSPGIVKDIDINYVTVACHIPFSNKNKPVEYTFKLISTQARDRFIRCSRALVRFERKTSRPDYIKNFVLCNPLDDESNYRKVSITKRQVRNSVKFKLTNEQEKAICVALEQKSSVIDGIVGSGKSQLVASVANWMVSQENRKVLICAPYQSAVDNIADILEHNFPAIKCIVLSKGRDKLKDIRRGKVTYYKGSSLDKKVMNDIIDRFKHKPFGNKYERLIDVCSDWMRKNLEEKHIKEANIVCCTLVQAGSHQLFREKFYTVIIDDAHLAHLNECIIPLMTKGVKQIVVVGDTMQSIEGSIMDLKSIETCDYDLPKFPQLKCKQRFSNMTSSSEPKQISFSQYYYQSNGDYGLKNIMSMLDWLHPAIEPVMIHGNISGDIVTQDVRSLVDEIIEKKGCTDIGILIDVPCDKIKSYRQAEVGTLRDFIGRQKECIILSRHEPRFRAYKMSHEIDVNFAQNDRYMFIALTRTKRLLYIVDNTIPLIDQNSTENTEEGCKLWQDLVKYFRKNNLIRNNSTTQVLQSDHGDSISLENMVTSRGSHLTRRRMMKKRRLLKRRNKVWKQMFKKLDSKLNALNDEVDALAKCSAGPITVGVSLVDEDQYQDQDELVQQTEDPQSAQENLDPQDHANQVQDTDASLEDDNVSSVKNFEQNPQDQQLVTEPSSIDQHTDLDSSKPIEVAGTLDPEASGDLSIEQSDTVASSIPNQQPASSQSDSKQVKESAHSSVENIPDPVEQHQQQDHQSSVEFEDAKDMEIGESTQDDEQIDNTQSHREEVDQSQQ